MLSHAPVEPVLPSATEITLAKKTSRVLASRISQTDTLQLRLQEGSLPEETVDLPAPAVQLLLYILEEMACGNTVALTPLQAELTTQQAADLLHISRPSLIQLLDEKQIPYRRIHSHRRIRLEDVMVYRRRAEEDRRAVLDELAAYDQELGI